MQPVRLERRAELDLSDDHLCHRTGCAAAVLVIVGDDGRPTHVQMRSRPQALAEATVLDVVRRCAFAPAKFEGRPVVSALPLMFSLEPKS